MFTVVRRWLNGFRRVRISLPNFRPIKPQSAKRREKDVAVFLKMFTPKESARPAAVTGDPDLAAGNPGKYETDLRDSMQKELDRLHNETQRELAAIDLRIKRVPPMAALDETAVMVRVEDQQESHLRSSRGSLVDSKRQELRTRRGLNAFKQANPPVLFRPARSYNLSIVIAGMLAVATIEMWINYQMLLGSGGHTAAEIVSIVVLTSLFNMLFGVLTGFVGVRNIGHVRLDHRDKREITGRNIAGVTCLVVGAALIFGLAFFMAHYRHAIDSAMDDPQTATNAALRLQRMAAAKAAIGQTMRDHPWAFFEHFHAVLIFVLGIVFGCGAAFEAYWFLADPYPGYWIVDRICRTARDGHLGAVKQFEDGLAALFQATATQLDELLERGSKRLTEIKICLDGAAGIVERYEKAATAVEHAFYRIIIDFRKEYRLVRETQGPAHWEEDIPTLNREGTSFDLNNFVEIEERATTDLQGLEDQVTQLKSALTKRQADAVSAMKEYLATVDQDAAREEELALSNLIGVRAPVAPGAEFDGHTGSVRPLRPEPEKA